MSKLDAEYEAKMEQLKEEYASKKALRERVTTEGWSAYVKSAPRVRPFIKWVNLAAYIVAGIFALVFSILVFADYHKSLYFRPIPVFLIGFGILVSLMRAAAKDWPATENSKGFAITSIILAIVAYMLWTVGDCLVAAAAADYNGTFIAGISVAIGGHFIYGLGLVLAFLTKSTDEKKSSLVNIWRGIMVGVSAVIMIGMIIGVILSLAVFKVCNDQIVNTDMIVLASVYLFFVGLCGTLGAWAWPTTKGWICAMIGSWFFMASNVILIFTSTTCPKEADTSDVHYLNARWAAIALPYWIGIGLMGIAPITALRLWLLKATKQL